MKARPGTITTSAVKAHFAATGRLMIATTEDGAMWATDSFLLVRVAGENHVLAKLLDEYNLPLEPVVCDVGRTVHRTQMKPPDVDKLVTGASPHEVKVNPFLLAGKEVFIEGERRILNAVMERSDGTRVSVDRAKREMVVGLTRRDGEWMQGDRPLGALAYVADDGLQALLMPTRSLLDEVSS